MVVEHVLFCLKTISFLTTIVPVLILMTIILHLVPNEVRLGVIILEILHLEHLAHFKCLLGLRGHEVLVSRVTLVISDIVVHGLPLLLHLASLTVRLFLEKASLA